MVYKIFCVFSFLFILISCSNHSTGTGEVYAPDTSSVYPPVVVGGMPFEYANGYKDLPIMLDTTGFRLWIADHKLWADALVMSTDTSLKVIMKGNELEEKAARSFIKNYNDSTLEIKDKYGNVVLQFLYRNGRIRVSGMFTRDTMNVLLCENEKGPYMELQYRGKPFQEKIKTVF